MVLYRNMIVVKVSSEESGSVIDVFVPLSFGASYLLFGPCQVAFCAAETTVFQGIVPIFQR